MKLEQKSRERLAYREKLTEMLIVSYAYHEDEDHCERGAGSHVESRAPRLTKTKQLSTDFHIETVIIQQFFQNILVNEQEYYH